MLVHFDLLNLTFCWLWKCCIFISLMNINQNLNYNFIFLGVDLFANISITELYLYQIVFKHVNCILVQTSGTVRSTFSLCHIIIKYKTIVLTRIIALHEIYNCTFLAFTDANWFMMSSVTFFQFLVFLYSVEHDNSLPLPTEL